MLRPLVDDILASFPPELAHLAQVFDGAIDELAETGDFDVFETPEFRAAFAEAHAFDVATCGWNIVEVNAVDYHFEGLPAEIPAGRTSFDVSNEGEEPHELLIFRLAEGATMSIEELVDLSEEALFELNEFVGVAWAEPGEQGHTVQDLTPGDYVAVCLIPTGGEDGPPHVAHGMYAEFTVVA